MVNSMIITFIVVIVLVVLVIWFTIPYRRPKCGSFTVDWYDIETGNSYKVCPKCGHSVLVGKEEEDESHQ